MNNGIFSSSEPANPTAGSSWINPVNRTVSVFDGTKWIEFSEAQLIEMEILQLLVMAGHSQDEAKYMVDTLVNSRGQNNEAL